MNWKIRIRNKNFWLTLVPAVLVLIQVVAVPFGYDFKVEDLSQQLIAIVNAVFVVLSILGIVNDPTTVGYKDTERVLTYSEPRKEEKNDRTRNIK